MRQFRLFPSLKLTGFLLLITLFCCSSYTIAQDTTGTDSSASKGGIQDTAGINKTTKFVLSELKEAAGQNESTWLPVLMILLVLCVVAFALWLSFRGPSTSEKRRKVMDRQRRKGAA
jgi:hypothetical protein